VSQILRTPLHWACTQKNEAVMEYLILAGADLTIKNNVRTASLPQNFQCFLKCIWLL
jgi:ankyrin repeat protein